MSRIFIFIMLLSASIFAEAPKLEMVVQNGHSEDVNSVAFSPDSKTIASGSRDCTIKVWDAATGTLLHTLLGHSSYVNSVVYSPDGKVIASGSSDNTIKLWDVTTGKLMRTMSGHLFGGVLSVAFSPDGKKIASGSDDSTIKLWDTATGKVLQTLSRHLDRVFSVIFSPNGEIIASGSDDSTIKIWNTNGHLLRSIAGYSANEPISFRPYGRTISFSPDGKYFATAWDPETFKTYNTATGMVLSMFSNHSAYGISSVVFSPDGKTIAAGSETVELWSTESGKLIRTLPGISGWINSVVFSPNGKTIATGDRKNTIKLVDIGSGELIRAFPGVSGRIKSVSYSPDGMTIAAGDEEGVIRFWDVTRGVLDVAFLGQTGPVGALSFSPDGKTIASGAWGAITLWNFSGGTPQMKLAGDNGQVYSITFSPDGMTIASGSIENTLKLWNVKSGSLEHALVVGSNADERLNVESVAFSPDGKTIAASVSGGRIKLWDSARCEVMHIIEVSAYLTRSIAYSPDGKRIVSTAGTSVDVWNVGSGKQLKCLEGHLSDTMSVAISPDGKTIASGSADNTIKLWDMESGNLVRTLSGHANTVDSVRFSPNGEYLLSGSDDTTIRVWRVSSGESITLIAYKTNDWLIQNNSGLFDSSPHGGQAVAMVRGLEAFSVDQFAVRNNRPDLLLGGMGLISSDLSNHYYAQYQKRLRRLGFTNVQGLPDESLLSAEYHVPTATIGEVKQVGKSAAVTFILADTKYNLQRYNVYVNDVPLFGAYGRPITSLSQSLSQDIELTSGDNKIEVSCMNDKGAESYRPRTVLNYNQPVRGNLYFLAFGVSQFKDATLNLKYADKDARDLAAKYAGMKGGFASILTRVLVNNEVTVANIKAAKAFVTGGGVDDTFVLFIAGHGVHDNDRESTYYYLTYETDRNNLAGTAANFDLIEELLQGIPPRQKLFLMDTCESGENDEAKERNYFAMADSRGIMARTTRGLTVKAAATNRRPVPRSYLFQKDRFIYNDLVRRSGAIVFSSCRGGEFSYESDAVGNGFFTRKILDGLGGAAKSENGTVSVEALENYVSSEVAILSGNLQHPTVDRDNIYVKFGFPVVK